MLSLTFCAFRCWLRYLRWNEIREATSIRDDSFRLWRFIFVHGRYFFRIQRRLQSTPQNIVDIEPRLHLVEEADGTSDCLIGQTGRQKQTHLDFWLPAITLALTMIPLFNWCLSDQHAHTQTTDYSSFRGGKRWGRGLVVGGYLH